MVQHTSLLIDFRGVSIIELNECGLYVFRDYASIHFKKHFRGFIRKKVVPIDELIVYSKKVPTPVHWYFAKNISP